MDVDNCKDLAVELGVRGVPTLIFFKDGKVAHKMVGVSPIGVIQEKINELLS